MDHTAKARIPQSAAPINPQERNRKLLIAKLAAGCWVASTNTDGSLNIPCANVPGEYYRLTIQYYQDRKITEDCTCPAMDGGPGSYKKRVIRWRGEDGSWHNNGVLPCSHILVARLYRQWLRLDAAGRADLLAVVPGLKDALQESGHI